MSRHTKESIDSRGTVLVASNSSLFINLVGDLVAECGFTPTFPAASEPIGLSVTRTQPVLAICDCDAPEPTIKRLVEEVSARRLPLLMAWTRGRHDEYARGLVLPERAAWLAFPVDHDAFRAAIDELLPQTSRVRRLTLSAPGVSIDAAIGVRTLDDTPPPPTPHRSIRLMP